MSDKSYGDDVTGSSTSERGRSNTPPKSVETPPTTTKKSSQPTKLVNLGAAAAFANQAAAEEQKKETAAVNQTSGSTMESVFGDFSGQGSSSQPPPTGSQGLLELQSSLYFRVSVFFTSVGFADFEGAFSDSKPTEPAMGAGNLSH